MAKRGKESETTSSEKAKYGFKQGHVYLLIGGQNEDITVNCSGCGSPYHGPCQSACDSCSTARKVFFADVTDVKIINSLAGDDASSKIATSLYLPNSDKAVFGDYSQVHEVVAKEVQFGRESSTDFVVAKELTCTGRQWINTLVIADNGSAYLPYNSSVETLITGDNVDLDIETDCRIDNHLVLGSVNIMAGGNVTIGNRRNASHAEVAGIIADRLNS